MILGPLNTSGKVYVRMLESGISQRGVSGILNVSQSVISRMWNRHLTHTDMTEDARQGYISTSGPFLFGLDVNGFRTLRP